MKIMPAIPFDELTKDIPEGHWIAISEKEPRTLVSHGTDLDKVIKEAREKGEPHATVVRVFRGPLVLSVLPHAEPTVSLKKAS